MGAARPAKNSTRWLAPAAPVFAGMPAPTGPSLGWGLWSTCGSGQAREEVNAVAGTGCAGVRGHARSHRAITGLGAAGYLWERVHPRRSQRGDWHRLRRCSRARPLPQGHHWAGGCGVPVGAGSPAKKPARWLAPAAPVFAGMPAPTGSSQGLGAVEYLGSGRAREEAHSVPKVRAAPTDRAGSSQNPAPAAPPAGAAGTPPTAVAPAVATHPAPSPAAHPPVPGPR